LLNRAVADFKLARRLLLLVQDKEAAGIHAFAENIFVTGIRRLGLFSNKDNPE